MGTVQQYPYWKKSSSPPNNDGGKYIIRRGGRYSRVECMQGTMVTLLGEKIGDEFEYLEVYGKDGKMSPSIVWNFVNPEIKCPTWRDIDYPPEQGNSGRSDVVLILGFDFSTRVGYYSFRNEDYIILGEGKINPAAFSIIHGEVEDTTNIEQCIIPQD